MTKDQKQELTLKITQANKTQMITILYEMILIYAKEAENAHKTQNRNDFRQAIRKTRGCVNELLASLNLEYDLAKNFLNIYLYINRELAGADVRNAIEPIKNVKKVVSKLRTAYETLGAMDDSAPVMKNAQEIYAGLTYGKNDLTESLADQGAGRGFRV